MKKTILIFTLAMITVCSTACSNNGNTSEIQPQSSTQGTVSIDFTPESKSDTADSETSDSVSQQSTSEVTSSDPISESKSDSTDTGSSDGTSKTALEGFIGELDGYDCAAAYVGYIEKADVNSVREYAAKSPAAAKYPFVADIPDDRIILAGGGEIYCIVPAKSDAKITVNSLGHDENGAGIIGDELYSGDNAPILLCCNVSDIIPNAAVSITNGDKKLKYDPALSMRDGRLAVPDDVKILDFSEY